MNSILELTLNSNSGIDFRKSVGIGMGIDFVGITELILLIFTPYIDY